MSIDKLHHSFHKGGNSKRVFLLLHSFTEGHESEFMQNMFTTLSQHNQSVFAFDFPYLSRREKPSDNLDEEATALQSVTEHLRGEGFEKISIAAKSLGGIVASRWLRNYPDQESTKVSVLGYVIGDVDTDALRDHLNVVVQGQKDRFGGAYEVRDELKKHNVEAPVVEIPKADHSFRNIETGDTSKQPQAIHVLIRNTL